MNQAVLAGQKFNERPEFFHGDNFAAINLSDLCFRRHAGDGVLGDLHAFGRNGENVHRAVVLDVNLATGFLDEAFDVLAARPDERANLFRVDADDFDARGVFAQFRARAGDCLGHFREDVHPRDASFFHRFNHEREGNALELEVELETGDAFFRSGDFAIHVAVMVFPANDVGKQLILGNFLAAIFGANADADARHRAGQGNTGIQQRQRAATDGRHRSGAVRLHDLAGDANGIGIILGQHALDAAFGERAVADFAAAGATDASGFADGEIREIVMEDEFFLGLAAGVGIKFLRVVAGAECGERDGLRFAARKNRRTMSARQDADFAGDRAHHIEGATVEALAAFQDQFADGFLLDVIKRVVDDKLRDFFRAEFFDELRADFVLDRLDRRLARKFAGRQQGGNETVTGERLCFRKDFVGNDVQSDFALFLAGFCGKFFLRGNDGLDGFLRVFQRFIEIGFGNFLGRAFIHHDVFVVADVNQIEIALGHFRVRGVGDEFSADATDANRAKRSGPRNVADHQRGARADDAQNIGIVFAIRAQQHGLDLNLVIPAFRKQRTNRTISEAARENFFFGRTAFAFEITAGEFSGGGGFFAIVNGQREKVLAGLALVAATAATMTMVSPS